MPDDIRFIRLKTGEDIVSKIRSENNGKIYTLTHPMRLMYMLDTSNPTSKSFGLTLQPWVYPSISSVDAFEISWVDVQTMARTSKTLLRMYHKAIMFYYGPFEEEEDPRLLNENDIIPDVLDTVSEEEKFNVATFVTESLQRISKKNTGKD